MFTEGDSRKFGFIHSSKLVLILAVDVAISVGVGDDVVIDAGGIFSLE